MDIDPDHPYPLSHVVDLYGFTAAKQPVSNDDDQWPLLSDTIVEVCPCTMWQVEYHDEDSYPGRAEDIEDALRDHRTECDVLDMLAGLRGIPA